MLMSRTARVALANTYEASWHWIAIIRYDLVRSNLQGTYRVLDNFAGIALPVPRSRDPGLNVLEILFFASPAALDVVKLIVRMNNCDDDQVRYLKGLSGVA